HPGRLDRQRPAETGADAGDDDDLPVQQRGRLVAVLDRDVVCFCVAELAQLIILRAMPTWRSAIRVEYCSGVTRFESWCGRWSAISSNATSSTVGPSAGVRSRATRCQRSMMTPVGWPVV